MPEVDSPKKYESALVSWARDKAFRNHIRPKQKTSIHHPEKPEEMVNIGSSMNTVTHKARGKGNSKNNLPLQLQCIKIAKKIRDILIREFKQQGQHDRIKSLGEEWWKAADNTEREANDPHSPKRRALPSFDASSPSKSASMPSSSSLSVPEMDGAPVDDRLAAEYAACLVAWSGLEEFVEHAFPWRGIARSMPHPFSAGETIDLGGWMHRVLMLARGDSGARRNPHLRARYLGIAEAVGNLLAWQYARLHHTERAIEMREYWKDMFGLSCCPVGKGKSSQSRARAKSSLKRARTSTSPRSSLATTKSSNMRRKKKRVTGSGI